MALKYFIEYQDVINITHKFNIYDDTFAGVATQIDGSIILNYSETDDPLEAIRGQGLSVQLEASTSMTFSDLWNEGEKGLRVDYARDSIILFKGWLNPEGFFENYVSTNWLITFVCVDGIGYLKDLSFVDNFGFQITGKKTYLEILSIALKRTGLLQNIYADIQIRYTGLLETLDTLDNTFANTERYVKDDQGQTIMDCDNVIRDVLEPFGAVLTAFKGDWYIYKPNQLFSNATPVFYAYDSDGIALIPGTVAIDISETIGSSINGFALHHCSENQQINNKNSLGAYRINYKYGLINTLISNKNLLSTNGTTIDGWDIISSTNIVPLVAGESGVTFNNILTGPIEKLRSKVLNIGDVVTDILITYTHRNSRTNLNFNFQIIIADTEIFATANKYYLQPNNTWGNVGVANTLVSTIPYRSSEINITTPPKPTAITGDGFLFISIFSPIEVPTATNQTTLETVSVSSNISPSTGGSNLKGEFHTFQRLTKPSAKVKETKEVSTGDNPTDLYEGTIYKRDVIFASTPILIFISATVDIVSFSWNPIEGVIGYKVYKDGVFSHSLTTINGSLTGLTASTSYDVQVLAYNSVGDGALSPIVVMTTTASGTTSTAPTDLIATNKSFTSFTLSWVAPTDFGPIVGYKVFQNNILEYDVTSGTSLNITGLIGSRNISVWKVSAYDSTPTDSPQSESLIVRLLFLYSTDDEIELVQYPSTKDAPPLTSGKVLSTDVEGKLALYTLPVVDSEVWVIAFSDETTAITTGVKKVEFQMPNYATTLVDVSVSFGTAPTTSTITIDLNENGTSVLSTKLTVDATEKTSETAAIPRVISDTALAANAVMTIDVDSADTGGTSVGGKLMLYWKKL